MAFDGIAAVRIVAELNQKLINSRMVKIYQPDRHTVILHLRSLGQTHKLVISADPVNARIHTTQHSAENPQNPPAFCMLLRKYLEPSRVMEIKQHELERIIVIKFETFDPNLGTTIKSLVFELMGRNSNIILIDQDWVILDAIHRNSDENHPRPIMPGLSYKLPPVNTKLNPLGMSEPEAIAEIRLFPAQTPIFKGLVNIFQGLSPQGAAEVCRRAGIDPQTLKQDLSLQEMEALWKNLHKFITVKEPPVLVQSAKPDFFAYRLTDVPDQLEFTSLDELVDDFYHYRIHTHQVRQKAGALQTQINTHLKRLRKKEQIQRNTLKAAEDADQWQKMGELILANLYKITKGDHSVTAVDYYDPNQHEITIELDPSLGPSENAQRYFKRYNKAKNSREITKKLLNLTVMERQYLEEVMVQLEQADDLEVLGEIENELIKEGFIRTKRSKKQNGDFHRKAKPYQEYAASDGTVILLGRNNRQNDLLTFRVAKPDDIWLHAQNIPGSHVILRADQGVSEEALSEAAALAAYYSKHRNSPKVPVDYTERKHVHKPKGAKPGFVTYNHFKTITADPTKLQNLPKKVN